MPFIWTDEALLAISKTPLWNVISPLFLNQHFWYLRAQTCVNFSLEWDSRENWCQVERVLSDAIKYNPFRSQGSFEKNGCNLLACKILLQLKYDPTVDDDQAIIVASEFGSIETIQLLLSDCKIKLRCNYKGIPTPTQVGRNALALASREGRLEVVKLLLADLRVEDRDVRVALMKSTRTNQMNVIKLLWPRARSYINTVNSALIIAVQTDSFELVTFFLRSPKLDLSWRAECPLQVAIEHSNEQIVRLLLDDSRTVLRARGNASPLLVACSYGNANIMRMLLEDPRSSKSQSVKINCIREAIRASSTEIIDLLLADKKLHLTKAEDWILNSAVENSYSKRVALTLIRNKRISLECMSESTARYVLNITEEYTSPAIRSAALLSGMSVQEIEADICEMRVPSIFQQLLRELVLRRLSINYYLTWLARTCKKNECFETREISSAASSFRIESGVAHTSALFTAYSGFILLAKTSNGRGILDLLKGEGASEEGLELAGMLIGAYLGDYLGAE